MTIEGTTTHYLTRRRGPNIGEYTRGLDLKNKQKAKIKPEQKPTKTKKTLYLLNILRWDYYS